MCLRPQTEKAAAGSGGIFIQSNLALHLKKQTDHWHRLNAHTYTYIQKVQSRSVLPSHSPVCYSLKEKFLQIQRHSLA